MKVGYPSRTVGVSREGGAWGGRLKKTILFLMKKTDVLTEPPNEAGEVQAVAVI